MSLAPLFTGPFSKPGHQARPERLSPAPDSLFSPHNIIAALLGGPLASLSEAQKNTLKKDLGESAVHELLSLSQEKDPLLFYQGMLNLGSRLEEQDKLDWALKLYSVAGDIPAGGAQARQRLDAILGKGSFGPRAEFLLKRFTKEATNPVTILPMLAGSAVAGLVKTAALSRFAAAGAEAWYSRGLGARALSGILAYGAEVPVFALSNRALRHFCEKATQETSVAHDLAGAAMTLGLLKAFNFAGHTAFQKLHGVNDIGAIPRLPGLAKFSQVAINQGSMFAGLVTAHKLEESFGLRAHVDGATTLVDTLASMFSMGVGAHLGHRLLGRSYADWNRELALHSRSAEQATKQPRKISTWLQNPFLAPMWMAMGAGSLGGFGKNGPARPASHPPSSHPDAELLNRDLNLIRDEALGLWKLQGLEENRAAAGNLFDQAKVELARAQARLAALSENPDASSRSAWQQTLEKITQSQIPFWQGQLEASALKRNLDQARYLQDIGIGVRRLLGKLSSLLAELYAEALPGDSLPKIGLRRPRPVQILGLGTELSDIFPALRNYDVGFGEGLAFRPHQIEALKRIRGWMEANRDKFEACGEWREEQLDLLQGSIVMPVGGGKTRVMVGAFATAIDLGLFRPGQDKFLILNHTSQIHQQNLEMAGLLSEYFQIKFGSALRVSEYKAEQKDLSGDLVVVSIPTVSGADKRQAFTQELTQALGDAGKIPIVAIDEVHHLGLGIKKGLETWQELLKDLRKVSPAFFRLGFTATPTGQEGSVLYKIGVMELMRAGVTPHTYFVKTPGIDLSDIPLRGADFASEALVNSLSNEGNRRKRHLPLLAALERHGLQRPNLSPNGKAALQGVLGFGTELSYIQALAEDYRSYFAQAGVGPLRHRKLIGLGGDKGKITGREFDAALKKYRNGEIDGITALVSGHTKEKEREQIFQAVARGEIEAVFSVDALVEGADLYMFNHQLGARPTFSAIKKGQERGRINRRGPDELDPDGKMLRNPPKILFEIADSYDKPGFALIPYGLVMGLSGHSEMKLGEIYDLMPGNPTLVKKVDPSAKLESSEPDEETKLPTPAAGPKFPSVPRPTVRPNLDPAHQGLGELLRDILDKNYQSDLDAMAWDLGEMPSHLEKLLNGEGWQNSVAFLQRISTLLYQGERDFFLKAYNQYLGKEDGKVSDEDYEVLQRALQQLELWEGFDPKRGLKIQNPSLQGPKELELSPHLLQDLHQKRLGDRQWRSAWQLLHQYFSNQSLEAPPKSERQQAAQVLATALLRHLFLREAWEWKENGGNKELLFSTRRRVALAFGGALPNKLFIAGVPNQNKHSSLSRWLRGEKIEFIYGSNPQSFYTQVRALLKGLGVPEAEIDAQMEAAVFAERNWPRGASSPQEALLLNARKKVALTFGGVLLVNHGIEGVLYQYENATLSRWLRVGKIDFSNQRPAQTFYAQVRALLKGLGAPEAEIDAQMEAAVFAERNWPRGASSPQEALLLSARKNVALVFGGVLPQFHGIEGIPLQSKKSPVARWLREGKIEFSSRHTPKSFYAQVRELLKGLSVPEAEIDAQIEAAVFAERNWPRGASSPQEALLLSARRKVALTFGGVLPVNPGIEGVLKQHENATLSRWLRGEKIEYWQPNNPQSFYGQVRALLKGLGIPEAEIDDKIKAARTAEGE